MSSGYQELRDAIAKYSENGEALEIVRAQELAAMTEEQARAQIRSLCVFDEPWRERPDWSGLVEQQAVFKRIK